MRNNKKVEMPIELPSNLPDLFQFKSDYTGPSFMARMGATTTTMIVHDRAIYIMCALCSGPVFNHWDPKTLETTWVCKNQRCTAIQALAGKEAYLG